MNIYDGDEVNIDASSISSAIDIIECSMTTTTTTTEASLIVGLKDIIISSPNLLTTDVFDYDPDVLGITKLLFNHNGPTQDIAHTENKLWLYGSGKTAVEYNITLNPFTAVYNRNIGPIDTNGGLCAIDDITLINIYGDEVILVDISGPTAIKTNVFSIAALGRSATGDYIYTVHDKLILTTIEAGRTYISQYDFTTGVLEFDEEITSTILFPYGIYQFEGEMFIINKDGKIYNILLDFPYTLTLVDTLSVEVNGASQLPSQATGTFETNI